MDQLQLFSDEEFMSKEELEIKNAKKYVARTIYRSSGRKGFINTHLSDGDMEGAYKEFDEAFRTFGFLHPKSYSFTSYRNIGNIRYYSDGVQMEIQANSKELFEILLECLKEE